MTRTYTKKVNTQTAQEQVTETVNPMEVIAALQKQLDELSKKMNEQTANPNIVQQKDNKLDANRYVKVVHLLDNIDGVTTHLSISNRDIDFRKFGDFIRLRLTEFEELYYKHRNLFEQNIIGLSSEDDDLIDLYNITCSDKLPINGQKLEQFPNMDEKSMQELYNSLSQVHRAMLIRKWYTGYYDVDEKGVTKNSVFLNKRKINLLNELSGGEMERLIEDLKYKEIKK